MLEVTVFDEDRDRSADFLGKIVIPLLHVSTKIVKIPKKPISIVSVLTTIWTNKCNFIEIF